MLLPWRVWSFLLSCLSLGEIESDGVYFLSRDPIAAPSELHLAHCNQTNHGVWWPMIALRLALLHTASFLSDTWSRAEVTEPWIWRRDRNLLPSLQSDLCNASDGLKCLAGRCLTSTPSYYRPTRHSINAQINMRPWDSHPCLLTDIKRALWLTLGLAYSVPSLQIASLSLHYYLLFSHGCHMELGICQRISWGLGWRDSICLCGVSHFQIHRKGISLMWLRASGAWRQAHASTAGHTWEGRRQAEAQARVSLPSDVYTSPGPRHGLPCTLSTS